MHPVLEVILKRKQTQSKPGARVDNYKVGLVIEGGGMRGIVTAGMVTGLEYLNLKNSFDSVYGSSAGAIDGAYFLANQAAFGTTIYYENANNSKFINIFRLVTKKPIMSLNYMFRGVIRNEKTLDLEAILSSPIPLKIIASSLNKMKAEVFESFNSEEAIIDALMASACMPMVGGSPIPIDDDEYLDASIFESIPYKTAIEDGCTHILALLTRPDGILRGKPSAFEKYIVANYLEHYRPGLRNIFLNRAHSYAEDIKFLTNKTASEEGPLYIYAIRLPKGTTSVGRIEKNRNKLIEGAKKGIEAVFKTFTQEEIVVIDVLRPFTLKGHIIGGK